MFSEKEIKLPSTINDFKILHKIGEGTFAEIFVIREQHRQEQFCLKRMSKSHCRQHGELAFISNEFEILKTLRSRFLPTLYYAFEDDYYVFLVMDLFPSNLYRMMNELSISLQEKIKYMVEVSMAIAFIHGKGYIYRDLKPENILVDQHNSIRLCDFGYSTKIQQNEVLYEMCGSYEYLPPQLLTKEGYNQSYDLYCLGLFFYELLTLQNPFKGIGPENLVQMKKVTINYEHHLIPADIQDLIRSLMKPNPQERLGYHNTTEIFKHAFFLNNKQVVQSIINNHHQTNLKQTLAMPLEDLPLRKEPLWKEKMILGGSFCYLNPTFDMSSHPEGPQLSTI